MTPFQPGGFTYQPPTRQRGQLTSATPFADFSFPSSSSLGLHVFLERLYFLRSSWVYASRAGPQGEATAGGLRCEEEKPALQEGESYGDQVFRGKKKKKNKMLCSVHRDIILTLILYKTLL